MKVSDFIFRFPTGIHPKHDGFCRVRLFVLNNMKTIALLTNIDLSGHSITNNIETICAKFIKKGFVPSKSSFIEHYEK